MTNRTWFCAFLSVFAVLFAGALPGRAQIAAYALDETSGTVAADSSGNGRNGTLTNGPTWIAGKYGNALSFDGANDYVSIGDVDIPASAFTLSLWVKHDASQSGWASVVMKRFTYGFEVNGTTLYFGIGNGSSWSNEISMPFGTGVWQHVAAVFTGSSLSLYSNGVQVGSAVSATLTNSDVPLLFGSWTGNDEFFNGQLDNVRLYDHALTPAEVQTDMNTPLGGVAPPDTTPPQVSVTSPASGSQVSSAIALAASASDNVGVVGVQFFVDGAAVGAEDTSAPYGVNWNTTTVANGAHNLTARARDAAGNTTTSAVVAVNVNNPDTTPPQVSVTSPAGGSQVNNTIAITATASDNLGVVGVQFFVDGAPVGAEDTSAPYAVNWDTTAVANGAHSLTARARDAAGNTTTSAVVAVNVNNPDTTPPQVSVTSPAGGSQVSNTVAITASASDNIGVVGVQFFVDGAPIGAEDTSSPYGVNWDSTAVANGAHNLTARARDAAGNTTTSAVVAVNVDNADTTPPQVSVTSPAGGSQVSDTVAITANASDNIGVVGVQFFVDGAPVGAEDTSAPYGVNWNTTTVADGAHNLTARARDAEGNTTTSAVVAVNVANADTTAPQVSMTSPAGGNEVDGTISLAANASDNVGVVGVQFFVDGAATGAEDTSAPYAVNWDTTTAANGAHNLTARARDAAGNTTTSAIVAVNVNNPDTTPPQVSMTSPASGSEVSNTISLTANASDNIGVAGVQFFVDGAPIGAEDTSAPYGVNWDTTTVADGAHNLTARARDAAGNTTTSAIVAVNVANADTTPPQVSMTSPAGGSEVSDTISLTANASDNIGVAGVQFFVDGAPIGAEDTSAPYGLNWDTTTVADGARNLTARARDAAGNTTTSAIVAVNVANADTTPPQVSVTSPVGGSQVVETIALAATASDNVGVVGVQFFVDGAPVGAEDTNAPYGVNWDTTAVADGAHNLTARARDAAGNTTTSVVVAVDVANNVDTTPPQVSVTSPAGGSQVSDTIALAATASDNVGVAGVQFFVDGAPIGAEDTSSPYGVDWNTTSVANGPHNLTARARDAAGNTTTSAIVAVTVSNASALPGQISSYSLDETSGTTAADSSGNGHTGTLTNGPTWVAGQYGNALSFDGANDYVSIGDVDIPANAFTLSLWVRHNTAQSGWASVVMKRYTYGFEVNGTTLYFGIGNGSTWSNDASMPFPAGAWQHVAAVYNGSSFSLYSNGAQVGGAVSATLTNSDVPLLFGSWTGSGEFFNGQIDNVRLYDRALTPAELQADMNTPVGGATPLDTTPPQVSVSSPAGGSQVSNTIAIAATASDNVGVAGVQFFVDGAALGAEDTTSPYGVNWNTTGVANGPHNLTARARDAAGNTTTSAIVAVNVANADTTPPQISITSPAGGSQVSGTITIAATASDNIGVVGVQFFVDGAAIGAEDTSAPYSVNWDTTSVANAAHNLTARARDAAGNSTTSAIVAVNVNNADTTPPQVSMTSPGSGTQVSDTIPLAANASDNIGVVGVQFFVDGAPVGAEDTNAPYGVNWDTTAAADGPHNLTARARDAAGNTTTSAAVPVSVANSDTTAPQVSVSSPAGGSQVNGTIAIAATASDNIGVAGVQFFVDGAPVGAEDTSAPYSVNWDTTAVANGARNLTARARDAAGNTTTSAIVAVTVNNPDTTAPQVSMTSPAGGAEVSGTIALAATASDNIAVVGVQFFVDGAPVGAEDTNAPYGVNWDTTTVADGARNLTARARDAAGNTTTSAVVPVDVANDVDTTPPQVSVTSPAGGSQVSSTISLTATASDDVGVAGVQFFVDGAAIGAEDTSAPYGVNWNTTSVANGSHNLTARARDAAGNTTTSAIVPVTVSNASALPGQISSYALDEVSGTTAADASGNGHAGTLTNGPTWVAGQYGNALSFDGNNDYVTIGDIDIPASAFTLSLWIRHNAAQSGWASVVMKRYTYGFEVNGTTLYFGIGNGSSWSNDASMPFPAGAWQHVAAVFNGSSLSLYSNGAQVGGAVSASLTNSDVPLLFGSWTGSGEFFSGQIDNVRLYDRALTPAEIQTDMTTPVDAGSQGLPDTEPPTATTNLSATATSDTQINLTWTAATDNVGVTAYRVERCQGLGCGNFSQIGSSGATSFSDTGLAASTRYEYRVRAVDNAGNLGPYSSTTGATTQVAPPPDTQPPTATTNLSATTASAIQINLTWTAATDNVGVAAYRVERCQGLGCGNFSQIGSSGVTSFSDTGLAASTRYDYRVRAVDGAGNLGPYSNTTGATTLSANPVLTENLNPGSNAWEIGENTGRNVSSDTIGQIKGYASAASVNKGENITLYVSVNTAQTYTINVYRMGWYQGLGGRLMQTIGPLNGVQQPGCPTNGTTGLIECNWTPSHVLNTQANWTSGVYLALLRNQQGFHSYIIFVVRDDNRVADLLYQQPVTTYQANNNWGGKSLFDHDSSGPNTVSGGPRAVKVSFDRPYGGDGDGQFRTFTEINFLRWAEKSGYDMTYSTNIDTHQNGARLLNYRGFLSVPHDEFWSKTMFDTVAAARDAGINIAFFGANSIYWQVRFEASSSGAPDRVIVCYQDANLDPVADPTLKTVKWRDGPLNRPEQTLSGVQYTDGPEDGSAPYVVTNSAHWVYAGTGFNDGSSVAFIVGGEADRFFSTSTPPIAINGTFTLLSHSPFTGSNNSQDYSNSSIYQAPSGAWVFGTGTMGWGWALDDYYHGGTLDTDDVRIQRTTANILDAFVAP